MSTIGLPRLPGISDTQETAADSAPPAALPISSRTDLRDLAAEFVFFTHGPVLGWSGTDFDPVQQYVTETPGTVPVMQILFDRPLFENVGGPVPELRTLDAMLFVTPVSTWPGLRQHLEQSGFVNRDRQLVSRTYRSVVRIPDYLRVQRTGVWQPPEIECHVFAVRSNRFYLRIERCGISPGTLDRTRLVCENPRAEDIQYANAVLNHENPFSESSHAD